MIFVHESRSERDSNVAPVVHGDFEWDDAKVESNLVKHGVAFEEAVLAMKDPLSLDFEDLVEPANLITLAVTPDGRTLYIVSPNETVAFASSARGALLLMNDDAMKKQNVPSAESLEEMPELNDERFRRRPGRGHHVDRSTGEIVMIEADLWRARRQLVRDPMGDDGSIGYQEVKTRLLPSTPAGFGIATRTNRSSSPRSNAG